MKSRKSYIPVTVADVRCQRTATLTKWERQKHSEWVRIAGLSKK